MLNFVFGNSITRRVEKQKSVEGKIEVLKKQQKVESERVLKDFDSRKEALVNSINAQVNAHKAEIARLNNAKVAQLELLDEQRKVTLDKTLNDFDRRIINKTNQAKRLGHLIEAEQKNIQDVISPDQPNAPKTIIKK